MELFLLEHKKLWRKMSTRVSVILCFIYVVVLEVYFHSNGLALGALMAIPPLSEIILTDIA